MKPILSDARRSAVFREVRSCEREGRGRRGPVIAARTYDTASRTSGDP